MNDGFYEGMLEILEVELEFDDLKKSSFQDLGIDWDSLAVVSTIALIDQCFDIMLNGRDLANCESIKDIMNLIKADES